MYEKHLERALTSSLDPLSAILQCADEINTILSDFKASGSNVIEESIVADSIDAAQTIALCAQHQKRIVDDVLTLSKLDSAMLMVRPRLCTWAITLLTSAPGNTSRCPTTTGRTARVEDVRRRGANSWDSDGVRPRRFVHQTQCRLGQD